MANPRLLAVSPLAFPRHSFHSCLASLGFVWFKPSRRFARSQKLVRCTGAAGLRTHCFKRRCCSGTGVSDDSLLAYDTSSDSIRWGEHSISRRSTISRPRSSLSTFRGYNMRRVMFPDAVPFHGPRRSSGRKCGGNAAHVPVHKLSEGRGAVVVVFTQ